MHTTWSDGAYSIQEMGEALIDKGYQYGVITDHSQYLKVANGLTPERLESKSLRFLRLMKHTHDIPTYTAEQKWIFFQMVRLILMMKYCGT